MTHQEVVSGGKHVSMWESYQELGENYTDGLGGPGHGLYLLWCKGMSVLGFGYWYSGVIPGRV